MKFRGNEQAKDDKRRQKQLLRAAAAIAMIVSGDGLLKRAAEKNLTAQTEKKLCKNRLVLHLFHNDGAALGALRNNQKLLLAVNSGVLGAAAGELLSMLTGQKASGAAGKIGLTLIVGGGCSNLLDRVQRGYVTDYFSIDLGARFAKLRRVVFNVSDFCVFAGSLLWMFQRTSKSRP